MTLVIIIGCLIAAFVMCILIIVALKKDIKLLNCQNESLQAQNIVKNQELEAIHEVQEKLKTSKQKKAPDKVEAPVSDDSDTRIARLNGLSDNQSRT